MKARRAILGLLIFGGILAVILAWFGAFSSREKIAPVPSGGDEGQNTLVGKTFRSEGANWVLTAPQAAVSLDSERITLTKPLLEATDIGGKEGQNLKVEADSGVFDREPANLVDLAGNVVVTLSGPQNGMLKTGALRANMAKGNESGETDQPLDVEVSTKHGMQKLSGRGAEFNLTQRTVKVLSEIRMEITGADILPNTAPDAQGAASGAPAPKSPPDGQQAPAEPILVTCDGPAMAEGFQRTAELHGHVLMVQGDRKLAAERMDLQFPESGVEPDRLVAQGSVSFNVGAAAGSGDKLVRTRAEGLLLLSGAPAVVTQDASEIRADRIEMDAATSRISVPVKGALTMVSDEEGAQKITVQWNNSLRFDPAEHTAVFRGGVTFTRDDQTIQCQRLTVRLDEANRQVKECFAEGDVRVSGKLAAGAQGGPAEPVVALGNLLTFYPDKDLARLSGGASIRQGENMVEGEQIDLSQSSSTISVTGPGRMLGPAAGAEGLRNPLDVSWKGGMTYGGPEKGQAAFQQEVTLNNGPQRMQADVLNVQLTKENKLSRFEATGNVSMEEETYRLTAGKVVASADSDGRVSEFVATGHVLVRQVSSDEEPERTMSADKAVSSVDEAGQISGFVATGRVVVTEGERKMRADRVVATLGPDRKMEKLVATGAVVSVEEQGLIAKGSLLEWGMESGMGVLTGAPVELRQGRSRLYGDRIEFSQELGSMRINSERRVEGIVVPRQPGITDR